MNLTEQERGALIDFVDDLIERGEELGYSARERKVFEIVLASLTAPPVADVVSWAHPEEERTCSVQLRDFHIHPGVLYTAPPVPVMKAVKCPTFDDYQPHIARELREAFKAALREADIQIEGEE